MLFTTIGFGALSLATASLFEARQQVCNGNAAFCDRKYSNVTLIGAHDSAFVGNIIDPRVNQEKSITEQLDAGLRFFEAQTHVKDNVLHLCHTSCIELDAGTLSDYLSSVKTWVDAHPSDVVTLLLTNGDNVPVSDFGSVLNATGLASYAFVPATNPLPFDEWPTYAELLSAGNRVIVFLDSGADVSSVPYVLPEFGGYFFETPYDTTDPNFPECTLSRPAGASPEGLMYIVNHFLDFSVFGILIPDDKDDYRTNAATGNGSIGAQADICIAQYGRNPNVVFVDFFDRGDVFTAQNNLNGL